MENMELQAYDIKIYDYCDASNPILPDIPVKQFFGNKRVNIFDNSLELKLNYKATTPNLLAGFLNINKNETFVIEKEYICSSQLFYFIEGSGSIELPNIKSFDKGDLITCSYYENLTLTCKEYTKIYWVCDYPLLQYMGLYPYKEIIPPTIYKRNIMELYLAKICNDKDNYNKNRNGILLGNTITEEWGTKTLTHILWALLNKIPANSVQKPHKHNSVALDYCVYAKGDVYTIMGKNVNSDGIIENPIKVYWQTGWTFTTPPGWWHSHINNSSEDAIVLPVQDAGLYTYQRTLDIQFIK